MRRTLTLYTPDGDNGVEIKWNSSNRKLTFTALYDQSCCGMPIRIPLDDFMQQLGIDLARKRTFPHNPKRR